MTDKYSENELERIMRDGLAHHAHAAADMLEEPLRIRSRRRGVWLGVAAATAAVAIGVPLTLQNLGDEETKPPPSADRIIEDADDTGDWRVESYGGLQVRVPPTWGWGGAPMRGLGGSRKPVDCGAAAFVAPGSTDYQFIDENTDYVGRPVMMSDSCSVIGLDNSREPPPPTVDSVWIGAAVQPGIEDLGNGYVQETVQIGAPTRAGDGTVTVTSDDPAQRRRILATVEAVTVDDNGCRADPSWTDVPDGALPVTARDSLTVCAYETYRGKTVLIWSAQRGPDAAAEYADQLAATSATYDRTRICTEKPRGEWLAIGVNGEAGKTAWTGVVMGTCGQILWNSSAQDDPESLAVSPVSRLTVAPWAGSETRAYVVGPQGWDEEPGKDGGEMFRGYLG